jgi:hypothetical protein
MVKHHGGHRDAGFELAHWRKKNPKF